MLKIEQIVYNGEKFVKTYSDSNKFIKQVQTGVMYAEAIDLASSTYTYEETNVEIPVSVSNKTDKNK